MAHITIDIERKVKPEMLDDLSKRIVYCSAYLKNFSFDLEKNQASFDIAPGADLSDSDITEKAKRFIEDMARGFRSMKTKTVFESKNKAAKYQDGVMDALAEKKLVWQLASGQMAFAGEALELLQRLDSLFENIGLNQFSAEKQRFPTLIPAPTLTAVGHFSSFPQSVTFVNHIHEDYDLINAFIDANKENKELIVPENSFQTPHYCLSPAVCYHAYSSLKEQALKEGKIITSVGKCFRYESANMTGLERLWDFTMREIIFVGPNEWVLAQRQKSMDILQDVLSEMSIDCTIETANDPFFVQDYATKTYYQLRGDLKYEIRLNVEEDRSIAVGSFNLHDNFFGKAFDISCSGNPVDTGCTAFGLERWVYAIYCQYGFEKSQWPAILRG